MINLKPDPEKLKSNFRQLKVLLILLTIIELGYLVITFTDTNLWMKLNSDYKADWLIAAFHISNVTLFLWYNWKRMPIKKKAKINYSLMILWLGIIGMWLWMPNERKLNRLAES